MIWLALVHVIVWYPAEILDAAVGYVFGFGVGFPARPRLLGCSPGSPRTRSGGTSPALCSTGSPERSASCGSSGLIHRGGALALLAVRLIPIMPFSLMGYVCGAARIPTVAVPWTTVVGYAPITAYFTYVGSKLEGFSAEDPILWIGGGALILAIFGVRFLLPHLAADPRAVRGSALLARNSARSPRALRRTSRFIGGSPRISPGGPERLPRPAGEGERVVVLDDLPVLEAEPGVDVVDDVPPVLNV